MTNLLLILLCLFVSLALVVQIAQRYGKPLAPEESQKMSKIIMILVGVLIVASTLKYFM